MIQRPDNITDLVFAAIRQRLVDASLPPGGSVSEAMLSKDLNVSKTPVREALIQLRQIGLIESTGRGMRVVVPTVRVIRDAFEVRAGLEAAVARHAAERATREQRAEIVNLAKASSEVGDATSFREADTAFHLALAEAADNALLYKAVEDAIVMTQVLRQRDVHLERDFGPDAKEHVSIARAVKTGDGQTAADRLSGHILRIMGQLLQAFSEEGDGGTDLQPAGIRATV